MSQFICGCVREKQIPLLSRSLVEVFEAVAGEMSASFMP